MEKVTNVKALEYVLENAVLPEDIAEKIAKIRDSYVNKSGNRKPTARQEENVGVKAEIQRVLEDANTGLTVTEIIARADFGIAEVTNQRVSALLKQMVEVDKTAVKFVDKKKSYFKAVAA